MYSVYWPPAKWTRYSSLVRELVAAAVGVVDEGARHGARRVALVVEERDRDVVGVVLGAHPVGPRVPLGKAGGDLAGGVGVQHVGVPEGEVAALAVLVAGLLPQAEDGVLVAARPAEREGVVQRGVGPVAALLVLRGLHHGAAIGAVHVQAQRVQPQRDHHGGGPDADDAVLPLDRELRDLRQRVDADGVGGCLVEDPSPADLDPDDVLADEVDPHQLAVRPPEQPGRGLLDVVDPLEPAVVVRLDHRTVLLSGRWWAA